MADIDERIARQQLFRAYSGTGLISLFTRIRWWHAGIPAVERAIPAEGTIVDLGCGHGTMTNYIALRSHHRETIGIDLSARRIQIADRGVPNTRFSLGNILEAQKIPCRGLLLADVLHHLESYAEQETLLEQCRDWLSSDGTLVVKEVDGCSCWKFQFTRLIDATFYYGDKVFFRTSDGLAQLLNRTGFNCEEVRLDAGRPMSHTMFVCRPR